MYKQAMQQICRMFGSLYLSLSLCLNFYYELEYFLDTCKEQEMWEFNSNRDQQLDISIFFLQQQQLQK